jgi:hypothetical protein
MSKSIKYPILIHDELIINDDIIKSLALSDPIVSFNNGNNWIILPLNLMLSYPIIWTKLYTDTEVIDVSIVICLRTFQISMFDGKLNFNSYGKNKLLLINTENSIIPIDNNIAIDQNKIIEFNKRYQVEIQTLRNALIDYPDLKYLHLKNKQETNIISEEYLYNYLDHENNKIDELIFHPKTLIHLIQYESKNKKKITLLIGSDANNIEPTGFDKKKSGFDKYVGTYVNKIIEKNAYIMPIFYYQAKILYPDSKSIHIS